MPKGGLSFVITPELTTEAVVQCAVEVINRFEFLKDPVLLLPMISTKKEHV